MKYLILLLCCIVSPVCNSQNDCDCTLNIILEYSQSNSGAFCGDDLSLVSTDGDAYVFNEYVNIGSVHGDLLQFGVNTGFATLPENFSVGALLTNEYSKTTCEDVVLVKIAAGGTGQYQDPNKLDWNVNSTGELHDLQQAQYNKVLAWANGRPINVVQAVYTVNESDRRVINAPLYAANLGAWVQCTNAIWGQNIDYTFLNLNPLVHQTYGQILNDAAAIYGDTISTTDATYCDGLHYDSQYLIELADKAKFW